MQYITFSFSSVVILLHFELLIAPQWCPIILQGLYKLCDSFPRELLETAFADKCPTKVCKSNWSTFVTY